MRGRRLAIACVASAAMAPGLAPSLPAGAAEPGSDCAMVDQTNSQSIEDTEESQPVADLQIDDVHQVLRERGLSLGGTARVAVVDSGIAPTVPATVSRPEEPAFKSAIKGDDTSFYYQGTAVAGLIAGGPSGENTIGFAPDAELVDVRVYDAGPLGDSDAESLTPENLVAGLQQIVDGDVGKIDIVNISLEVPKSRELKQVIDALTSKGIIVVAASGNRPASIEEPFGNDFGEEPEPGEDAAKTIFPAGYADPDKNPLLVSVTSTASDDDTTLILPNSRTTVAAPSADAVTYAVNDTACHLVVPSTTFATAEVSGVLALLRTAFPNDSPRQLVARLKDTAAGSAVGRPGKRGRTIGFGVVQPREALTRIVDPSKKGDVDRSVIPQERATPVVIDPPAPDRLRSTRRNAVWWGLGGGGALVIALLLRPVIARRRPQH